MCVGFGAVVKIVQRITAGFDSLIHEPALRCTVFMARFFHHRQKSHVVKKLSAGKHGQFSAKDS